MTYEGLGEMFEGDSADTCARKFPLMLMGERANGPACADVERGPPSASVAILINFIPKMFQKCTFMLDPADQARVEGVQMLEGQGEIMIRLMKPAVK